MYMYMYMYMHMYMYTVYSIYMYGPQQRLQYLDVSLEVVVGWEAVDQLQNQLPDLLGTAVCCELGLSWGEGRRGGGEGVREEGVCVCVCVSVCVCVMPYPL